MISYTPLYETLKQKNLSTYKLIKDYNISRGLLDRLRHNQPISTVTLNDLCRILDCKKFTVQFFTSHSMFCSGLLTFWLFAPIIRTTRGFVTSKIKK